MATATSADIASTILRSAVDGYYPDSELIAAAPLSAEHLPTILDTLEKSKEAVKEEIRRISQEHEPEVDSWISQARSLREDIRHAEQEADEIIQLAEQENTLTAAVTDATTQRDFLQREIAFSEALASILGKLQLIGATLGQAETQLARGELADAVGVLGSAADALARLQGCEEVIIAGVMKQRCGELRGVLVERTERAWEEVVGVGAGQVVIRKDAEVEGVRITAETVVRALQELGLLKEKADRFWSELDRLVVAPRLATAIGEIPRIGVEGERLRVLDMDGDLDVRKLYADLVEIMRFLNAHLPEAVMGYLQGIIVPQLTHRLVSTRLVYAVPAGLDNIPEFEQLLEETKRFEQVLVDEKWTKERELSEWVDRAPKVWFKKRRETVLAEARKILEAGMGELHRVERSETQVVEEGEMQAAVAVGVVGPEAGAQSETLPPVQEKPTEMTKEEKSFLDEEDVDAGEGWGLDDDLDLNSDGEAPDPAPVSAPVPAEAKEHPDAAPPQDPKPLLDDDDIEWDEWGAGDDDEEEEPLTTSNPVEPVPPRTSTPQPTPAARRPSHPTPLTLTETYTITSIPLRLLALTRTLTPSTPLPPLLAPTAPDLPTLPTHLSALYRALAPSLYHPPLAAPMHLYTDATHLSHHLPSAPLAALAARTYTHTLATHRHILLTHLDDAGGFAACSDPARAAAADTALAAALAHLAALHTAWAPILSASVLQQALGRLLAAVAGRFVADVQELEDIGAGESAVLAGYVRRVRGAAEGWFGGRPEVFCDGWRRLGLLEDVLAGGLRDVEEMWRRGALREEFEPEEVVGLVKALFAESEWRRRVLEGVRRGRWVD